MSQTFTLPGNLDDAHQSITVLTPAALETLRSSFSGASAPATPAPVAGQLWLDTVTGQLKMRNGANSAWIVLASASSGLVMQLASQWQVASMSATSTQKLGVAPRAGTIKRLIILAETASTSSSGNEWQFSLLKRTVASPGSTVALFSGTVGTFTSLGGVGGGAETVAHKAYVLTPDQNASVGDLDVLELTITKVGSATTLTNVRAFVEME